MRIAFVSQEYPPHSAKGGIGTQCFAKAHGMTRRGHEVTVISRCDDAQRKQSDDAGVRLVRVAAPRLQAHTELADWVGYSVEVAAEIAELHADRAFDLIEFPEWGCEAYAHLLNRTEWNQCPTVIQLHGPLVMLARTVGWPAVDSEFFRVGTQIESACLRLADAVYSSSACSADWCSREYGLPREQIPILHTGVDTRHFAPRPAPHDDRPTIVFAGKITWNKGVLVLLEAAMKIAGEYPGLRVRMFGQGEKHVVDELQRRAAASGHAGLLELPGFIDRERLPDELSRGDVFAAPSRYEGGPGFVYLEAMACGLPVIACAGSGAAEVVIAGENGLLVPPDDAAQLAEALRRLLSDDGSMARRARAYAVEHVDAEPSLDRLDAYYRSVVHRCQGKSV